MGCKGLTTDTEVIDMRDGECRIHNVQTLCINGMGRGQTNHLMHILNSFSSFGLAIGINIAIPFIQIYIYTIIIINTRT